MEFSLKIFSYLIKKIFLRPDKFHRFKIMMRGAFLTQNAFRHHHITNLDFFTEPAAHTDHKDPFHAKCPDRFQLILIFIYYYKGVMSINDIQTILQPITERYFKGQSDLTLEDIYNEVFSLEREEVEVLKKDLVEKFTKAGQTFKETEEEERKFLQLFSFVCMLSFDVYVKKLLIEKLLDAYSAELAPKGKKGQPKNARETAENGPSGNNA